MNNNTSHSQTPLSEPAGGNGKRPLILLITFGFVVAALVGGFYVYATRNQIYAEKSLVNAPSIDLSAQNSGKLNEILVKAGDTVSENQTVAQVGNELVKAKIDGVVIQANNEIGKTFSPGQAVVTMIDPKELRIEARVEEDKGFKDIKVGQKVFFTVDAFGSEQFQGVVDQVSPTSRDSDVVFNISNQRQENEFNVEIRYDISVYPQLKNGMSAKAWIYKD